MRVLFVVSSILALLVGIANADSVETIDGDVITGEIIETTEDGVVIENPTLGRVTVPSDQIKPPEPPAEPNPGLFGTRVLRGFTRNLSFGAGGTRSQVNDANVNIQVDVGRDNERHRQAFAAKYYFSSASPPPPPAAQPSVPRSSRSRR